MTAPRPAPRLALLAAAAAVLALGAYLRTRGYAQIYLPDAVLGVDTDCYYHLRRALLCLRGFPWVPVVDPWLAWPDGAAPTWGPGFDQILALPAWLLGAREGLPAQRIIAAVPVLLGLFVIVAVARLARALETDPAQGDHVALAAGVLAAAMPQAVYMSQLGATDHHVVEALAPALLVHWAIRHPTTPRQTLAWEARGALLLALLAYAFPGTVLTHGLVAAALAVRSLMTPQPRRPIGALGLLGASLLLGALAARWTLRHGETFHHLQLSALQPLLLAVAGVFLGLLGLVPGSGASPATRALTRLLGAAAGLSTLLGVLALTLPGLRREVVAGVVDWLFTRDPWMATIGECLPLFHRGKSLEASLRLVWITQGVAGLLLPVLAPLALVRLWRGAPSPRGVTAATVATVLLGLAALALTQNRFLRGLSGLVPVVAALGLAEAATLMLRAVPRAPVARAGLVALALSLASLGLGAFARDAFVTREAPVVNGLLDAALHLRPSRPVTPGRGDGVLAPWDTSFEFLTLSERPVVVSGFGPYLHRALFEEAEAMWTRDEAALVDFLQRRDAGFLVAVSARVLTANASASLPPTRRTPDGRTVINAALLRLRPLAALSLGGSGSAGTEVRHLEHLWPRFADRGRMGTLTAPLPEVWVYERVAGAVLRGEAPAGTLVVADLELVHHGVRRTWQAWTRAVDGRWALTVPLPTGVRDYGVHTAGRYVVHGSGALRTGVVVSEADVRAGRTVPVTLHE